MDKIKISADGIQQKIVDYDLYQTRLSKLPEMEKRHALFAAHASSLDVIIGADQEVELIKLIENLAEETKNKVKLQINDKIEKKKTKDNKENKDDLKINLPHDNFIVMQLFLEGNYDQFLNFLSKIENLKYYVNVTSIVMTKAEEKKEDKAVKSGQEAKDQPAEILKSLIELVVYIK